MTAAPAAVLASAATACGHLDLATRDRITGWAAGLGDGDPVSVQVLDNGRPLASVVANGYRHDLLDAGYGDGWHGFDLIVPGGLSPLVRHVIQARRESDGADLVGSPHVIEAADSFDPALQAAVAQAVAAVASPGERDRVLAFLATQTDALLQQHADEAGQRTPREIHRQLSRRQGADPDAAPGKRALLIDERMPVAGQDAGSQALLSHIDALHCLGYAVSLVAADDLAGTGPDGVALCGAPFYASVEEVLRRQTGCFDLVYLHRASTAARYLALARRYQPRARILYSVADLHHLRLERQAVLEDRPELLAASRALRLVECTAAWSADAVLTHSADEAGLLRRAVPDAKVYHVPWAIPVRPGAAAFADRQGVAFIGHYRHAPNADAAQWLLDTVMPLVWQADPAVPCLLVGSDLPAPLRRRADGRVRVLGHVADLGALLNQVRLTVAPLRFGAGVKGKVLESLAAAVPCAMSPVAAEGMLLPPALLPLVAQDTADLAALIVRLHTDAVAHAALAAAGVAFVRDNWNAAVVVQALSAAIDGRLPVAAT